MNEDELIDYEIMRLPAYRLYNLCKEFRSLLTPKQQASLQLRKRLKIPKKTAPELNWMSFPRRHIALKIAYNGDRYQGLAIQKDTDFTVEGYIVSALRRASLIPTSGEVSDIRFDRCGRTDKGVSAVGQVLSFYVRASKQATGTGLLAPHAPVPAITMDSRTERPAPPVCGGGRTDIDYISAINCKLPSDIRALAWSPVDHEFSSRHSSLGRYYCYTFGEPGELDVGAMNRACQHLIGEHDFRNFCKLSPQLKMFTRVIFSARVQQQEGKLCLRVHGSAFLWHQIRCIAGLLTLVGSGLERPDLFLALLDVERNPGKPEYALAPPQNLVFIGADFTGNTLAWQCTSSGMNMLSRCVHCEHNADQASSAYGRLLLEGVPPVPWHPLLLRTVRRLGNPTGRVEEDGVSLQQVPKYRRILSRPLGTPPDLKRVAKENE
eukprot:gnl/Dysnectes_brevis/3233_a4046_858.p1 GENE.gnl/Dysnectes_brevis/3233_a4046_858~~gnl/Dysnectes_brevis/3233_a4046_858.p1  ORF type:complete len:435 (+),score=123.83 gnl/Dysnectes_brevis/3233_a4046_858:107-1411(+)